MIVNLNLVLLLMQKATKRAGSSSYTNTMHTVLHSLLSSQLSTIVLTARDTECCCCTASPALCSDYSTKQQHNSSNTWQLCMLLWTAHM
jgi:hypothetical protein